MITTHQFSFIREDDASDGVSLVWLPHGLQVRGGFKGGTPSEPPLFLQKQGHTLSLFQKQGVWLCVGAKMLPLFLLEVFVPSHPHWKFPGSALMVVSY